MMFLKFASCRNGLNRQFMELFNVFELKILGYYLELSVKKGATVFLFCLR